MITTTLRIGDRVLGAMTLILSLMLISGTVYAVHAAVPFNAVELPVEASVKARMWSPQGWKFFTRNPREDVMKIFSRSHAGEWTSAMLGPNTSSRGWFGFSRVPRAQGIEYGMLLYGIPQKAWTRCEGAQAACLNQIPIATAIYNRTPKPTLCGTVGFVQQVQVPWAWANLKQQATMPSRVLKVMVKC